MPFTFKLSKRLALMKTSLAASAVLTLACTSDLTDPQPHRNSLTPVAISADLTPLAATGVVASGYQDPNVPQNTLDNNLATRWSANGDGQWIRYDLGAVMAVGAVDIAWYQGTAWASAFEIQVSLDTLTWTPVFSGRSSGQTLQPERYDFSTVTGRYIQIVGHGQWSGTTLLSLWNSITEVAIYGSAAPTLSPVSVATVLASGYQDPNVPQNTLDNNLATRWSANGDGQWIRYDLGAVMAVGAVDIAWYQGTAWASAFEIQVSLDTLTWTPVFSGQSSGQTLQPERYDFSTVTGRYIRIVGHGQWNSITEVAIYDPPVTVNPVPVTTVTVSASSASVSVGSTQQLSAVVKDASGNVLTGRTVTWTSNDAAVALVSWSGLVTGLALGSATMTATSEGKSGTATLTVVSPGAAPQPGPTDTIILQDGFESGDLSLWTADPNNGRYSITTDPTRVRSGTHSLQALYTPTNAYGLITRWFMPGYDEIYVKFSVLFEEGFQNIRPDGAGMHFFMIAGNRIDDPRSSWGKPAIVPNGTDYFWAGIDPEEVSLPTLQPLSYYTYWPDMSCCYGNVLFQQSPKIALVPGQWHALVPHVKLNAGGQYDGSQTVWLNGVKKLDQQNMRWRTTTDLRLNEIRFDNYMNAAPQIEHVWVDDVTVWRP